MNYETLSLAGIILLVVAGLLFVITILLFIRFNVISIIGDLTGRTARRQIEQIRNQNFKSGNKKFKPSPVNSNRGKLTEHMSADLSGRKGRVSKAKSTKVPLTSEISTKNEATEILPDKAIGATETEVLTNVSGSTGVLSADSGITGVLANDADNTEILNDENSQTIQQTDALSFETDILSEANEDFEILKSIVLTHTTEVI